MFSALDEKQLKKAYEQAKKRYAAVGVDTEAALARLARLPVSLHCWQGDDVAGFEVHEQAVSGGGLVATGNYPGAARNGDELRGDAAKAMSLIPGSKRFNLHAIYAETNGAAVPRDQLQPAHFEAWMNWAAAQKISLDFNPSFFAHPLADSGYTLAHADDSVRGFWVRHGIACRRIAEAMGRRQGNACVINHWIPDGAKDSPVDRWNPRARLVKSLDEMLAAPVERKYCLDAVEAKLFGIGSEDFVVGSHEFYLGYAFTHDVLPCLDMGHFHPTETIHDKLSAILTFKDKLLLHVSRGIRWDSDHVVLFNDDVRNVFAELVRGNALERAIVALDFFDASINRIGAWVIGARATLKAALAALLDPVEHLQRLAAQGDMTGKLALLEEVKTLPIGAVWDTFCRRAGVPAGTDWLNALAEHDRNVTRKRPGKQ